MMYLCALCPSSSFRITCIDPKRPSLGSRMTSSRFRTGSKRSAACASVDHLFRSVTSDMMSWLTTEQMDGKGRIGIDLWRHGIPRTGWLEVLEFCFVRRPVRRRVRVSGSGQITKGLTESQRPVPDITSQRRSPRKETQPSLRYSTW